MVSTPMVDANLPLGKRMVLNWKLSRANIFSRYMDVTSAVLASKLDRPMKMRAIAALFDHSSGMLGPLDLAPRMLSLKHVHLTKMGGSEKIWLKILHKLDKNVDCLLRIGECGVAPKASIDLMTRTLQYYVACTSTTPEQLADGAKPTKVAFDISLARFLKLLRRIELDTDQIVAILRTMVEAPQPLAQPEAGNSTTSWHFYDAPRPQPLPLPYRFLLRTLCENPSSAALQVATKFALGELRHGPEERLGRAISLLDYLLIEWRQLKDTQRSVRMINRILKHVFGSSRGAVLKPFIFWLFEGQDGNSQRQYSSQSVGPHLFSLHKRISSSMVPMRFEDLEEATLETLFRVHFEPALNEVPTTTWAVIVQRRTIGPAVYKLIRTYLVVTLLRLDSDLAKFPPLAEQNESNKREMTARLRNQLLFWLILPRAVRASSHPHDPIKRFVEDLDGLVARDKMLGVFYHEFWTICKQFMQLQQSKGTVTTFDVSQHLRRKLTKRQSDLMKLDDHPLQVTVPTVEPPVARAGPSGAAAAKKAEDVSLRARVVNRYQQYIGSFTSTSQSVVVTTRCETTSSSTSFNNVTINYIIKP